MPAPKGNQFAIGNKGGRPTKLTPELLEHAKGYLDSCIDDPAKKVVNLPSVEGLAIWLNVSRDTVLNWQSEDKEFFGIYQQVKAEQGRRLQNNGLAGTYNPTIAKLILATHHGMSERTDVTSGGEKIGVTSSELESKAEEAVKKYLGK